MKLFRCACCSKHTVQECVSEAGDATGETSKRHTQVTAPEDSQSTITAEAQSAENDSIEFGVDASSAAKLSAAASSAAKILAAASSAAAFSAAASSAAKLSAATAASSAAEAKVARPIGVTTGVLTIGAKHTTSALDKASALELLLESNRQKIQRRREMDATRIADISKIAVAAFITTALGSILRKHTQEPESQVKDTEKLQQEKPIKDELREGKEGSEEGTTASKRKLFELVGSLDNID